MFGYFGLESATVPAGDVSDAKRTVPHSSILGISIAAPARLLWGPWGAIAISAAVILSSIGAQNGWTLLMGQVPMAAAKDGLFPPVFGHLSRTGPSAIGLVVSAALATRAALTRLAKFCKRLHSQDVESRESCRALPSCRTVRDRA